jgi:hypothetical protein
MDSSLEAFDFEDQQIVSVPPPPTGKPPQLAVDPSALAAEGGMTRREVPGRTAKSIQRIVNDLATESVTLPEPPAPSGMVMSPVPSEESGRRPAWLLVAIGAIVATVVFGAFELAGGRSTRAQAVESRLGKVTLDTRPAGAEVTIDGQRSGLTPLTLSVSPGLHSVTVSLGDDQRVVPLTVEAGSAITQHFEMRTSDSTAPVGGRMSIVTDPAGAQVSVDGQYQGISPVTVGDLEAAEHRVSVTGKTGSAERLVRVEPGGTVSVVFSLPNTSAPVGGWLAVDAPFAVEVLERDDVVGASGTTKIMLAAGRHDLVLVNRGLQYSETRSVDVVPGRVATVRVDPPKAPLSVNALPWAEVVIDGASLGQTPIANIPVAIGTHEVMFPTSPARRAAAECHRHRGGTQPHRRRFHQVEA